MEGHNGGTFLCIIACRRERRKRRNRSNQRGGRRSPEKWGKGKMLQIDDKEDNRKRSIFERSGGGVGVIGIIGIGGGIGKKAEGRREAEGMRR